MLQSEISTQKQLKQMAYMRTVENREGISNVVRVVD